MEALGVQGQARADLANFLVCPGERDWWQIAESSLGTPVDFVIIYSTPGGGTSGIWDRRVTAGPGIRP